MAAAFGREPRLLARNLSVIPKACFYAAMVRRDGCEHIHAHWATVSTSAAMLMSRVSGTPFSFTGHAWDIFCDTRLLSEKADAARFVLTCTAFNRQHLIDVARVDRDKVHVLYHGLRLPAPADDRAARPSGPLEILTVGRWSEKKGFLDLIEALAVVRDQGVPFKLRIIAGDGSAAYERRVRETIAARALDDRVSHFRLAAERGSRSSHARERPVRPPVPQARQRRDGRHSQRPDRSAVGAAARRRHPTVGHSRADSAWRDRTSRERARPAGSGRDADLVRDAPGRDGPALPRRAAASSSARSTSVKPSRCSSSTSKR